MIVRVSVSTQTVTHTRRERTHNTHAVCGSVRAVEPLIGPKAGAKGQRPKAQ